MSGNLWMFSDKLDDEDIEIMNLDLGLYIIAETKCPEMVTSTCAPFFLSIPMSPVSGSNATDGNTRWLYDVTIYPKNLTGIPTLTKSLRENVNDTGKHKGATNDVTDGYANTGTASDGDVIDYQILSTLASITSKSTYYSELAFIDTLSPGLSYNKNDIQLIPYPPRIRKQLRILRRVQLLSKQIWLMAPSPAFPSHI